MDTIAFCIDNLFADNESLKKMVTSYQQTLNRQQVVQLLRGYFNEDVARLMQGSDNLFTENFVYAVLVLQRIKDNRESPDDKRGKRPLHRNFTAHRRKTLPRAEPLRAGRAGGRQHRRHH